MKNMMKEYIGNEYSDNHLKNFCLYWMKGRKTMPEWENTEEGRRRYDDWRRKNDLDCLYFDGDLRADTLMSTWTPIKWVAECLNRKKDMKFYKKAEDHDDPDYYLKLLAFDRDEYLPREHELVKLLDRFLELAELRCNYILLPDRDMNTARYKCVVNGRMVEIYDEVPVMLYHIFDKEWFGKYFEPTNKLSDWETDHPLDAVKWIKRERLEIGFIDGIIDQEHVIPLLKDLPAGEPKKLTKESEIKEALLYMIKLLEARMEAMERSPYIMIVYLFKQESDMNMGYDSMFRSRWRIPFPLMSNRGYDSMFRYGQALMEDGTIIPVYSDTEYFEEFFPPGEAFYIIGTGRYPNYSEADVREDYWEEFQSRRQKGKTFLSILNDMAEEIIKDKERWS